MKESGKGEEVAQKMSERREDGREMATSMGM